MVNLRARAPDGFLGMVRARFSDRLDRADVSLRRLQVRSPLRSA